MEFISEGIFGKYLKIKILVLTLLKKGNFEAFFRPSPLKLKNLSKNINGSICAYRPFYLPIFRRIEGGGDPYGTKKRGPERVNIY